MHKISVVDVIHILKKFVVVFIHGVRMSGWAGGGKKFVQAVSQKR